MSTKDQNADVGNIRVNAVIVVMTVCLWLFVSRAGSCLSSPPPPQDDRPQFQNKKPLDPSNEISGDQAPVTDKPAAPPGPATRERKCDFTEIKLNAADDLLSELKGKVHGQPDAVDTIAVSIRGHLVNRSPPKALVLSLHGPTGVGKTFVSEIIANSIYVNGTKSVFVQKISLAKSYTDTFRIGEYMFDLRERIVSTLKRCARSLFIIEEFDTNSVIANQLSTVIKLFVEHDAEPFDGVTTKKAIFIFISNQGSTQIIDEAVQLVKPDGQWQCFSEALWSLDHCFTGHKEEEDKQTSMKRRIHELIKQLAKENAGL